jgi:Glycosyl transferases group 1
MRLHFTHDDRHTSRRARDLRAALVHAGHVVTHGAVDEPVPARAEIWFHGLGANGQIPCDPGLLTALTAFSRTVVLFQNCDSDTMSFHKIPPELGRKTRLFLRNHWPHDRQAIPAEYRSRLGYLTPMLRPITPVAGAPLAARSRGAMFYGTPTGKRYFPEGRERLIALLRDSGLPFEGGLSPDAGCPREPPPELMVARVPAREHARRLRDTKICLAPWGNHKLTYRLFEGLAARCLVVAPPFSDIDFLDGGLTAGVHYVETAPDYGDLVDVVRHYLEHEVDAQRIADAGHAHFRRCFAPRGRLISAYLFEQAIASWGELYRPPTSLERTTGLFRSVTARLVPTWF